jgi:hypothetical protein
MPHNSSLAFWLSSAATLARIGPDDKIIDVLTIDVFTDASTLSSFHKSF